MKFCPTSTTNPHQLELVEHNPELYVCSETRTVDLFDTPLPKVKLAWRDRWMMVKDWLREYHHFGNFLGLDGKIGFRQGAMISIHNQVYNSVIFFAGMEGGEWIDDEHYVICVGKYTGAHIQLELKRGGDAMNTLEILINHQNWISIHWGDECGLWAHARILGKPFGFVDKPIEEFPF